MDVSVEVFDINGKLVRKIDSAGSSSFAWDGRDSYGKLCESGMYVIYANHAGKRLVKTVCIAK